MRYALFILICTLAAPHTFAKAKSNGGTKKSAASATPEKRGGTDSAASSAPGKREEGDFVIEKRGDGSTVKYKKKTSYDFEGSSIDGIYNKPSGAYISNIKDVRGKSVLKIRENFDNEVSDSSRLVK